MVLGAAAFAPLKTLMHRWIDRFVYHDIVDIDSVFDTVQSDLRQAEQQHGVIGTLIGRIVHSVRLESTLVFLGDSPTTAVLTNQVGPDAGAVAGKLRDIPHGKSEDTRAIEFNWESNSMLLTPLSRSGTYLGYVVWGPKSGGEIFVPDERRLIENVAPILTLVLEERALSEKLRDVGRRLLKAEESERRRIAQDLHDGALQKAIILGGFAERKAGEHKQLALQLATDLREICSRLRPSILDDLGLAAALDWLLQEAQRHTDLKGTLHVGNLEEDQRFPPDLELAFFRVTQESISNIIKHAGASSIDVWLDRDAEGLSMRVVDDGVGFSQTQVRQLKRSGDGLGLPGMRERILQIGGRFEILSAPGDGAELKASAPIDAREGDPGHAD